jgi:hypothetical protein
MREGRYGVEDWKESLSSQKTLERIPPISKLIASSCSNYKWENGIV